MGSPRRIATLADGRAGAGGAGGGRPGEDGGGRGGGAPRRERGEERDVPLSDHEEARRVGADPEIRHVPERRIPGIAPDEVPALRHECENEESRIRQELVARDEPRKGDEEREQREEARDRRGLLHTRFPATPRGREMCCK